MESVAELYRLFWNDKMNVQKMKVKFQKLSKKQCSQIIFITETNRQETIRFYEKAGFNPHSHTGFKSL